PGVPGPTRVIISFSSCVTMACFPSYRRGALAPCDGSRRHRDLVTQLAQPAVLRGIEDGEADFQGRLAPAPVGKRRTALRQRVDQFQQLGIVAVALGAGDLLAPVLGIDRDAVGRLAQYAALAGDNGEAEEGLARLRPLAFRLHALFGLREFLGRLDRAGEPRLAGSRGDRP